MEVIMMLEKGSGEESGMMNFRSDQGSGEIIVHMTSIRRLTQILSRLSLYRLSSFPRTAALSGIFLPPFPLSCSSSLICSSWLEATGSAKTSPKRLNSPRICFAPRSYWENGTNMCHFIRKWNFEGKFISHLFTTLFVIIATSRAAFKFDCALASAHLLVSFLHVTLSSVSAAWPVNW